MKIQFLIYFLIIVNSCYSQKAMTFERAREKGIRSTALDSLYKSGIHADTSLAVFKTNQEEYITAYQQLLGNLGKFLKANIQSYVQYGEGGPVKDPQNRAYLKVKELTKLDMPENKLRFTKNNTILPPAKK